jgi:hypothetical protein
MRSSRRYLTKAGRVDRTFSGLFGGHKSVGEFIRFCGCAVVNIWVQETLAYGGGA